MSKLFVLFLMVGIAASDAVSKGSNIRRLAPSSPHALTTVLKREAIKVPKKRKYSFHVFQTEEFVLDAFMSMTTTSPRTKVPSPDIDRSKFPTSTPSNSGVPSLREETVLPSDAASPVPSPETVPPGNTMIPWSRQPTTSSVPVVTSDPTLLPTASSAPSKSPAPSMAPSASSVPSTSFTPSINPTSSLTPSSANSEPPSLEPSSAPTPTAFRESMLFKCTVDGIDIALPPYKEATTLDFRVGYLVESVVPFEDYREDLEMAVIGSALAGALQCLPGSKLFLPGSNLSNMQAVTASGNWSSIPINTSLSEEVCFPEVDFRNDCLVLETDFQVVVAKDVDSELSRFLGYVEINKDMESGMLLTHFLPNIERIQYLSPLPLLPPVSNPQEPAVPGEIRAEDSSLSVTPWTIGAVLAMSIGGVVALWVWNRNRRKRNQQHLHLLDESSLVSAA